MNVQLKRLPKLKSKNCLYCNKKATGEVRVGIGRVGYYFPCCSNDMCIVRAKDDARARALAHQDSAQQTTLEAITRSGETIRHRLISALGITLGWNGKYKYARPRNEA